MEKINERIKEIRDKNNLSQKAFADALGVTQAYISVLEKGNDLPSKTLIKLVASLYHEDEEWIISGKENTTSMDLMSNDGLSKKWKETMALMDKYVSSLSDKELKNFVQGICFYSSIFTAKNLSKEQHITFTTNLCLIADLIESLTFKAYALNLTKHKVSDTQMLRFKIEEETAETKIREAIRNMVNTYMESYNTGYTL